VPKKTPPKRRPPRPVPPPPDLAFEPWSRQAILSVTGGLAIFVTIVGLTIWSWDGLSQPESAPRPEFNADVRRAVVAEATETERDSAFAKVSWGEAPGATPIVAGGQAPVTVPISDGRAVVSLGLASTGIDGRKAGLLSVTVLDGDRRLFGNVLNTGDAAGSTGALTVSLNAAAVREAGVSTQPLTLRVAAAEAVGSRRSRDREPEPLALAEARFIVSPP